MTIWQISIVNVRNIRGIFCPIFFPTKEKYVLKLVAMSRIYRYFFPFTYIWVMLSLCSSLWRTYYLRRFAGVSNISSLLLSDCVSLYTSNRLPNKFILMLDKFTFKFIFFSRSRPLFHRICRVFQIISVSLIWIRKKII